MLGRGFCGCCGKGSFGWAFAGGVVEGGSVLSCGSFGGACKNIYARV